MKLRTSAQFQSAVVIDGVSIDVRIKRLTNVEWDEFRLGYLRAMEPRGSEPETAEARAERNAETDTWLRGMLRRHVTVLPGQIAHDSREVTDASDLLDIFGARQDVVPQLISLIHGENVLREDQKKIFRSALASQYGSRKHPRITTGAAPAPTAARVDRKASASAEAVTASNDPMSSGMTGRSISARAQSDRSRRT